MKFVLCSFSLLLGYAAIAETITGTISGRDADGKAFTLKVDGKDRKIGLATTTKYCQKDGSEQTLLGSSQMSWWKTSNSAMKVTVETAGKVGAEVATKITFPVKIMTGGPTMKLPAGAKYEMVSKNGGPIMEGFGAPSKAKGKAIPAFNLTSIDGKTISSEGLKGKVYLLDFWSTWCKPCTMLSTELSKIQDELKSKGFQVIGVNARENGNALKAVKSFMKEHKASYPVTAGSDKFADQLGVSALPSLFLVDKNGVVSEVYTG